MKLTDVREISIANKFLQFSILDCFAGHPGRLGATRRFVGWGLSQPANAIEWRVSILVIDSDQLSRIVSNESRLVRHVSRYSLPM